MKITPVGWWVTFPWDLQAGLLLESYGEKIRFAKACEVDLDEEDLLLAADLADINECPDEYYQFAKFFREVPF